MKELPLAQEKARANALIDNRRACHSCALHSNDNQLLSQHRANFLDIPGRYCGSSDKYFARSIDRPKPRKMWEVDPETKTKVPPALPPSPTPF